MQSCEWFSESLFRKELELFGWHVRTSQDLCRFMKAQKLPTHILRRIDSLVPEFISHRDKHLCVFVFCVSVVKPRGILFGLSVPFPCFLLALMFYFL
jgi:hypothetical protein